ncbi:hypothetical protein RJ55_06268 [Drechmeria coniospora]|nr:hypothetical protein RJ55_06268 [Drechmeria coniospora]
MTDNHDGEGLVERRGKLYRPITEGKATILVPHDATAQKGASAEQKVFYNPIQQYNRDLSTLAIKAYGEWMLEQRRSKNLAKQGRGGKKRKRGEDDAAPVLQPDQEPKQDKLQEQSDTPTVPNQTFKILDALSASGLRALRYGHELPFNTSITANDLSESAVDSIKLNVEFNNLQHAINVTNEDALGLMYRAIADDLAKKDRNGNAGKSHKFDVVDLDPYGTAAPFFDAAIQSVRDDGGLLCVTCTDSAVWAGHSYCEKAFALYGGVPVKGMHSHEAALRLILNAIASSGAKYGLAIEPLLSLSIDFYTKVFVKVTRSPQAVKFNGAKTMLVYSCDRGCHSWQTQPLLRSKPAPNKNGIGYFYKHGMALGPTEDRFCHHCGFKMHVAGPMYAGHIHNQEFVQRLLDEIPKASPDVYKTLPRLEGMLRTAQEEFIPGPKPEDGVDSKEAQLASVDHCPFFVIPGKVSSAISCTTPTDDMFRGALIHLGYQVGRSHCRAGAIKTDAPWSTIWWIMTEWVRQKSPIKASKYKPSMAAWKILHDAGLVGQGNGADETNQGDGKDVKMVGGGGQSAETEPELASVNKPDENPGPAPCPAPDENDAHGAGKPEAAESELRKTLVFDAALAQLGRQRGQRYVRYQMNPSVNWGPMTKAKGN